MTELLQVEGSLEKGTIDLSRVKLTVWQLVMLMALTAGFIGTSTISLYQLSEVRKAQTTIGIGMTTNSVRIGILEQDKARREGIEIGLALGKAREKSQGGN